MTNLTLEDMYRFDYKIISSYARNILIESCEINEKALMKIRAHEADILLIDP
jgi:hypothetical protein